MYTQSRNKNKSMLTFGDLNVSTVRDIISEYEYDPKILVTTNAFHSVDITKLVTNHSVLDRIDHLFSNEIDHAVEMMNQESAGLCWMCAGMSMCRRNIMKKLGLKKDFQLSLNYLLFWDKLERCNYFMKFIIDKKDTEIDDSTVSEKISSPISDGGYWHTFADLVDKYGLVPDNVCKRKHPGKNTSSLNKLLRYKLQEFASCILSPNIAEEDKPKNIDDIELLYNKFLRTIIRLLVQMLGTPFYPETVFDWSYVTSKGNGKKKITLFGLTPMTFYREYSGFDITEYVPIMNDPRPRHPYRKMYEMNSTDNMVLDRAATRTHLKMNLDINEIIPLIKQQIDDGIPVWIGCDVGKFSNHTHNVFDTKLYNYGLPFDTSFTGMTKGDRLDFSDSYCSHVMTITGYDVKRDYDVSASDTSDKCHNSRSRSCKRKRSSSDAENETDRETVGERVKKSKRTKNVYIHTDSTDVYVSKFQPIVHDRIKKKKAKKIVDPSLITKFKIENSWGDIGDNNGVYAMSIDWFKEYAYEVVIHQRYLTEKQAKILKSKPIKMKSGDPLSKPYSCE